jgi:hypothetical protein
VELSLQDIYDIIVALEDRLEHERSLDPDEFETDVEALESLVERMRNAALIKECVPMLKIVR